MWRQDIELRPEFRRTAAGVAFLAAAGLAVLFLWAARGEIPATGEIRGDVRIVTSPPGRLPINPYPGRANAHATPLDEDPDPAMHDVVVYLEDVPPPFHISPPAEPTLAQVDQTFQPSVLPVLVGQSVAFPNRDPYYHNVFSYSPTKRFDIGRYPRGKSRSVTFPKRGEVRVFCDIHSDMAATILVLQNPYFTRPDEEGRFNLPAVPPGEYRLVVWHPDIEKKAVSARVEPGGVLQLHLQL